MSIGENFSLNMLKVIPQDILLTLRHIINSVIKVNYKSFYMQFNANLLKCFLLLGLVLVHGTDALMQPKEKDEEKDEV